ncbi:hypothetical protein BDV96DRAFT_323160 [Lophiotrema nucula]|uniref:AA1-like domain-containing protein n=1 Tax=Lophiotrema nucula TaxID=690887 RepID=A0A6A5ZLQ0_9PLEO|nr:hypothetical protein BDV96DRAFT_323160 [Lophiotrema nucula]
MKSFAILSLISLGLAAPSTLQKRAIVSVTVYKGPNYTGDSATFSVDTTYVSDPVFGPGCDNRQFPASFNNQIRSIKFSPHPPVYCKLFNNANCANGDNDTFFFNEDVPDLSADPYTIGTQASSIFCATTDGSKE